MCSPMGHCSYYMRCADVPPRVLARRLPEMAEEKLKRAHFRAAIELWKQRNIPEGLDSLAECLGKYSELALKDKEGKYDFVASPLYEETVLALFKGIYLAARRPKRELGELTPEQQAKFEEEMKDFEAESREVVKWTVADVSKDKYVTPKQVREHCTTICRENRWILRNGVMQWAKRQEKSDTDKNSEHGSTAASKNLSEGENKEGENGTEAAGGARGLKKKFGGMMGRLKKLAERKKKQDQEKVANEKKHETYLRHKRQKREKLDNVTRYKIFNLFMASHHADFQLEHDQGNMEFLEKVKLSWDNFFEACKDLSRMNSMFSQVRSKNPMIWPYPPPCAPESCVTSTSAFRHSRLLAPGRERRKVEVDSVGTTAACLQRSWSRSGLRSRSSRLPSLFMGNKKNRRPSPSPSCSRS
jgi:hypothetical protein